MDCLFFITSFPFELRFRYLLAAIAALSERAFRSRVTLAGREEVELWKETPNGLSAVAILPVAGRECQRYLSAGRERRARASQALNCQSYAATTPSTAPLSDCRLPYPPPILETERF